MDRGLHDGLHPLTGSRPERRPRLGNPLESEQAAFRWVIAVIVGAAFVIALAELVSSTVGFVAALLLGATVAVVGARGAWRMIRGTDEIGGDGDSGPLSGRASGDD